MYVEVIPTRPTYRRPRRGAAPVRGDRSRLATYTYRLPERLHGQAGIGQLVQVPMRRTSVLGVIAGLADALPPEVAPDAIRDVSEILDPLPVVTAVQIALARWIADETLSPLSHALRLMLPPGLEGRTFFIVTEQPAAPGGDGLAAEEAAVLRLLRRQGGRMSLAALVTHPAVRGMDSETAIETLAERGLIEARFTFVPTRPAPPRIHYVRLLADDQALDSALPMLGRSSKAADALVALARRAQGGAPLSLDELCGAAGCPESAVRNLEERGWVEITRRRTLVVPLPGAEQAGLRRAPGQARLLSALIDHHGPIERDELLRMAGASAATLRALEGKALVRQISEPPLVLLTLPPAEIIDRVVELRGAETHRAVLEALRNSPGRVWVGGIYAQTGADLGILRELAEHGLVSLHAEEYERPQPTGPETPPKLTPDQEAALRVIEGGEARVVLLHGVTGSGKTEIYLRALGTTLAAGRRAIVLVPEISLTAQTVRRFEARFPGRVAVLHSQLSEGQRYDVWERVRRGEADVLVGPRSALFAPMRRLGLVVVDEAHDSSYKQEDGTILPAYHAVDVAVALGRLAGASTLIGSATPDLAHYYRATQGAYRLVELPRRVLGYAPDRSQPADAPLPPVRVVDLRQELRAGNRSIFSRVLQEALRRTLAAREQAILFLNRRGMSTFILCRDCGYVSRCPRCEVPLTYHREFGAGSPEPPGLVCHHCNHRERPPVCCPQCHGRRIRYFGLGTERVESSIRQLFPDARLVRWDRDTATGSNHERFLQTFIDGRADVLIGTQMIAKGLDLPLVTLVGVISADPGLYLPDFRAAERTFQLLTQVAGRAGRSARGGQVIVQTYNPDHYAIQAAARHDYAGFYRKELAYRRQLGYPPFSRLVALRFSDEDEHRCRTEAERLGKWLAAEIRRLDLAAGLIGPAPCFFGRIQGRYRWQIVIRATDPMRLLRDLSLPWGWRVDVDPVNLL